MQYFRLETSEIAVPDPAPNVEALVRTDAGFVAVQSTPTGDGGFSISGVPNGEYYLRYGFVYVVTSRRTVNFDDHNGLGRPGTPSAANGVPFSANMTGLSATDNPELYMASPNTGTYGALSFPNVPFGQPEMALTNEPGTLAFILGGLPSGVAGDPTYFWQFIERDAGVLPPDAGEVLYVSAQTGAALTGLSISPSGGALNVNFVTPPSIPVTGVFKQANFLQWTAAVHPQTVPGDVSVGVYPTPNPPGGAALWSGFSGALLYYFADPTGVDIPLALEFRSPLPSSWIYLYDYSVSFSSVRLPGTTSGGVLTAIGDTRPQPPAVITPRISPARSLTFDSVSATSVGTFATRTPTIRWMSPQLGAPSVYVLEVYRLTAAGTRTVRQTVGRFLTQGTEVRLPPGVLVSGGQYAVHLSSWVTPGVDPLAQPLDFWLTTDLGRADAVSSIWLAP